ncbi:T9SS type A sorting domain-containing protein [Aquimarina sp. TRL1]|uniref:fibronectin type III domain-containing protein n=1 Tax=Aquimarina sp. (strain TRL1) TaxID=2736252 RepID=UPI0015888CD5|nr:fibronectin type III domain-containing protein [Aquimarina sp. TRL1]QKX03630.1 T9SS type A sorting domain-containing protein [Aquimarina sp. TRL1]
MKTTFLRKGILSICIVFLSSVLYLYHDSDTKKNEEGLQELRDQHLYFLENSPFKESLLLTKKARKKRGIPPNKYFEQMWELTMNPKTGRTEPEKIFKVQKQLKSRNVKRAPGENNANAWKERGPNDVGGRTRAILFDPNDQTNRRVFAGGVSGGLWVNNDITSAASQWTRVQNVPGNLSVTSITVDPRNSNIWYIGTGEQYTFGDVVGTGVYRSVDGGNNWQIVNIPPAGGGDLQVDETNLFLSGIYFVNDIIAWENTTENRTELFVGVGANIYLPSNEPRNWLGVQSAGMYHSIDGGATWNRIESANMRYQQDNNTYYYIPNDFEIGADNRLWMGTINFVKFDNIGGGRVFSSVNGATWVEAAASPLGDSNRVELEPSATDPNKIYALTQGVLRDGNNNVIEPVHIYRTTDGFATNPVATALPVDHDRAIPIIGYDGIPANDFTRGQAFYDLMIEADPTNDNVVYVGGIDLFRSANGGNNWTQISKWSNNSGLAQLRASLVHADQHAMVFRPGNTNQAIFGNDGGVYYASDLARAGDSDVISKRVNNYNVTQYVKAGIGPNGARDQNGIFTAGSQDNGSQAFRNAVAGINGSEQLSGGDGFYTFVDKDGEYMISTYVFNNIHRYKLPWDGKGQQAGGGEAILSEGTGDFVNQMGYDNDANFILSNASKRGGNTSIKTIDVANNRNGNIDNQMLTAKPTAFVASTFANNTWYVGAADGKLFRLTNVGVGAANWAEINTPFVGSVSSVRLGATANDLLVTIHNYGVTSIWYSSDAGVNWVSKEGNLPDIPVRDILQNPLDRTEVIVATQLGVWMSNNFDNANPVWRQSYNGMSDVSVTSFDYWAIDGDDDNNIVIASTYGRGVFTGSFTANGVVDNESPTAPTNLVASNVQETSLELNWGASNDNVGVTAYDIYRDDVVVATVAATSETINGLTANTAYRFKVRAKDAAGNHSAFSNIVSVKTLGGTGSDCQKVTGVTATDIKDVSAIINWDATAGAAPYTVEYKKTSDSGYAVVEATSNTLELKNLKSETAYQLRIKYTCKGTTGDICDGVAPWRSGVNYQPGDKVVYDNVLYQKNSLNRWDSIGKCGTAGNQQETDAPYSDVITFTTKKTTGGGICEGVASWRSGVIYRPGDKVVFQGFLFRKNNWNRWDNLGPCNGSKKLTSLASSPPSAIELVIYQEPFSDILSISLPETVLNLSSYQIFDVTGKVIMRGEKAKKIDVGAMENGMYVLKITSGKNNYIKRFLKH